MGLNRPTPIRPEAPLDLLELRTADGCALAIGPWPRFRYDASGGGGRGEGGAADGEGWRTLSFAPGGLTIPPLDARSGRIRGVPLPPALAIAIAPSRLEGRWRPESGAVELAFEARFQLLLAGRSPTPDLQVNTRLVTGAVAGQRQRAQGSPLDGDGRGVLVGVAQVPPTGTWWLDCFLGLPGEALAVLGCQLLVGEGA
jgi:hypothetical protein